MSFCRLYPSAAILPQVVAKLVAVPLGHHRAIFDNWATAETPDLGFEDAGFTAVSGDFSHAETQRWA